MTVSPTATGITPMYQALNKLMGAAGDEREVVLIYGSKSFDDILMKDELDSLAAAAPGRLKVVHVLGDNPEAVLDRSETVRYERCGTENVQYEAGWIDQRIIAEHAHPAAADTQLFVCGLPAMYSTLCGPRTEADIATGSVLHRLGYTEEMVAKM